MTKPKHQAEAPKRAVLYVRVGRDPEDSSASVDAQAAHVREFAERHGYASSTRMAPGFRAMLERLQAGGIDTLLVEDLPKLTRDCTYFQSVRRELRGFGVDIATVADQGRPLSEEYEEIVQCVARYLAESGREKVRWYGA
jgi:DNA invertase Pin-like site-specific DNA recombinase